MASHTDTTGHLPYTFDRRNEKASYWHIDLVFTDYSVEEKGSTFTLRPGKPSSFPDCAAMTWWFVASSQHVRHSNWQVAHLQGSH